MPRVVAIVGPTGVGKSELAVLLAQRLGGEIVSADSRQMYRYMDIGTAKPTPLEMATVRHHLIDVASPSDAFGLADYQQLAYKAIGGIQSRGNLPFLVGGTGQYVWAVVEGWQVPKVVPDLKFRAQLEDRARRGDGLALYEELIQVDPNAARKIDPRNVRRVIRALEVTKTMGRPFSSFQRKKAPDFQTLMIGLTAERNALYARIDARVDKRREAGLVDEVKNLVSMGYGLDLPAMSGIGYRQIGEYLKDRLDLESAVKQIKTETHRFVRHQYNWFRLSDGRIKWFDVADENTESEAAAEVRRFVQGSREL